MRKLNDHAEEMPPRVPAVRLRTLSQCLTKSDFFDFFGFNAVKRNVIHSIWRPDEFVELHSFDSILAARRQGTTDAAGNDWISPCRPMQAPVRRKWMDSLSPIRAPDRPDPLRPPARPRSGGRTGRFAVAWSNRSPAPSRSSRLVL